MCFAVIAGRKATADGSVLFGHSEQNFGRNVINYRRVPRKRYHAGEGITLTNGGFYPFEGETYSYLWSESPKLEFSDNCFNEFGVAVAGDGCPTKEDDIATVTARGDICDGGIGYLLPQMIAMLAKTASEGVDIAISLIEKFGYTGIGRSLMIADPNEAWVLSLVRGKHYLACRVPDDKVVIVPNVHVIGSDIAWDDPAQTRYSPGLIEYAIKREWYNPDVDEVFNFSKVFNKAANPETLRNKYGVDSRQWFMQAKVTGQKLTYPPKTELPFAVKPQQLLDVKNVMKLLRSHLEDSEFNYINSENTSPHRPESQIDHCYVRMACNIATQESVVFQLRSNMPPAIGCVAWRALSVPCLSVFTPWYCGITKVPSDHYVPIPLSQHFEPPVSIYEDNQFAFWSFYNLVMYVNENYEARAEQVLRAWREYENEQFIMQPLLEEMLLNLWHCKPSNATGLLNEYTEGRATLASFKAKGLVKGDVND